MQTSLQEAVPAFTQTGFIRDPNAKRPKRPEGESKLPKKPKKRIIICCDGTWQSSAHGSQTIPSNVAKMSRSIADSYIDENGLAAPQLVYYDAGVGTAMGWLDKKWAGGFGEGLDENVCEAYNFIVNNYLPGDELFFFGFSRGAYTVRACAGLVCRVGICRPSAMNQFWEMYANYKSIDPEVSIKDSLWGRAQLEGKETYTIKVKGEDKTFAIGAGQDWLNGTETEVAIKVVGVWDTVGSLGYPANIWRDVTTANKPYGFHNTDIHRQIENAFHALALEEHRKSFSPTLWSLPPGSKTNLIQCWFPGVHINVGGGSGDGLEKESKGDLEIMSITTFFWMVDRCHPFLRFDIDPNIEENYRDALRELFKKTQEAKSTASKIYSGWGIGPVLDPYYDGLVAAAGSETRTPGHYFVDKHDDAHEIEGEQKQKHKPEHHHKQTNEYMHPVVQHARAQNGYNIAALEGFKRTPLDSGRGHHWVKKYPPTGSGIIKRGWSYLWGTAVQSEAEEDIVSIPEFVIPLGGKNTLGQDWTPAERKLVKLERRENFRFLSEGEKEQLEDVYMDNEGIRFLKQLDEDNKNTDELHAWNKSTVSNSNPKYELEWWW